MSCFTNTAIYRYNIYTAGWLNRSE